MRCKYLTIRTKNKTKYCYCRLQKEEISFSDCNCCKNREYKDYKKLQATKIINEYKFKKHKLTKHTEISPKVKRTVWERDNHKCIFCNKEVSIEYANSHYIKRSQLGLGIEENIMTNCYECHKKFDDTSLRKIMLPIAKKYFETKYKNWNEKNLVYKK